MNEELLQNIYVYQLSVLHRLVWKYFMKKVYPKIKQSHRNHLELLDKGHIAHLALFPGQKETCVSCKYRDLLK